MQSSPTSPTSRKRLVTEAVDRRDPAEPEVAKKGKQEAAAGDAKPEAKK